MAPIQKNHDYLSSDPEIADQRFALLSVVMPQSMVQKRELFYVTSFFESVAASFYSLVNSPADSAATPDATPGPAIPKERLAELTDLFQTFREENSKAVDAKFAELNENRTSVFGLKIRAVSSNIADAKEQCRRFQTMDPMHNIFLAEVGKWLPLQPDIHALVKDQQYSEQRLNELIGGYEENKRSRDALWQEETRARVEHARTQAKDTEPEAVSAVSATQALESLALASPMPVKDV
jgi:hypothetical protein